MSKHKKKPSASAPKQGGMGIWLVVAAVVVAGAVAFPLLRNKGDKAGASETAPSGTASLVQTNLPASAAPASTPITATASNLPVMEANKAVMVTVELDFGGKVPTIAEALKDIERRHQPDDGQGRVFAILDAYGEPTPNNKLHVSMHVSSEKPGVGALVFKRTGEVLWQSRIVASTNATPFTGKNLTILLDDGTGKSVTVDGSKGPASIMDAGIKEAGGVPVNIFWPDGAEREMTFIYSACGCPVKAMVKRTGDKTVRTKDLPVMFPDDPSVMLVINRLMGW